MDRYIPTGYLAQPLRRSSHASSWTGNHALRRLKTGNSMPWHGYLCAEAGQTRMRRLEAPARVARGVGIPKSSHRLYTMVQRWRQLENRGAWRGWSGRSMCH
ncbi:unnamed protein product [Periconia digitata]|uniref:Uncharacterized protein n=1 Tax=Periconia digitata TaxID=1303443 RepID=A0A9W4UDE3_9PLEO|nr:unnamed protein product [Periconia digitata]